MILSIAARLIKELDIVALEVIQVIVRRTFIGDHAFNFFQRREIVEGGHVEFRMIAEYIVFNGIADDFGLHRRLKMCIRDSMSRVSRILMRR